MRSEQLWRELRPTGDWAGFLPAFEAVVANVRAEAVSDPEVIRQLLVEQVTGSVRWRESVLWMAGAGVTEFWEIGAGKALSGMIKRTAAGAVTRARAIR